MGQGGAGWGRAGQGGAGWGRVGQGGAGWGRAGQGGVGGAGRGRAGQGGAGRGTIFERGPNLRGKVRGAVRGRGAKLTRVSELNHHSLTHSCAKGGGGTRWFHYSLPLPYRHTKGYSLRAVDGWRVG